jgi:hypothetical protein
MMVGISLWGGSADEKVLRGRDTFAISSRNYAGDPYTYYLYTTHAPAGGKDRTGNQTNWGCRLKSASQLLSNDEGVDGFSWRRELKITLRNG